MPIYEYECTSCKHRFEEIQRFSEPSIENCPLCSEKVRKILFAPAVIFKASGFYATEYGKSKPSVSASGPDDGKVETKAATKGDNKTETKSESKSECAQPAAGSSVSKEKAAVGRAS